MTDEKSLTSFLGPLKFLKILAIRRFFTNVDAEGSKLTTYVFVLKPRSSC